MARRGRNDRGGRHERNGDTPMREMGTNSSASGRGGVGKSRPDRARGTGGNRRPYGRGSDRRGERIFTAAQNNDNARVTSGPRRDGRVRELRVTNWIDNEHRDDQDNGLSKLLSFLTYRASAKGKNKDVKIQDSWRDDDAAVIMVRTNHVASFLHVNGFEFGRGGPKIKMEEVDKGDQDPAEYSMTENGAPVNDNATSQTAELRTLLENFLRRQLDPSTKILDLSELGRHADLQQHELFESESRAGKSFKALMTISDKWLSPSQKKDNVEGVSLANNGLHNAEQVTTLAQAFPNLKKLDLSNNAFKTMGDHGLGRWATKFRDLEHIVITGNEIDELPETRETLKKWYPKLRFINTDQVRTLEEVFLKLNPIPVAPPSFQDQGEIAANFVTRFFLAFDTAREDALNVYYDEHSTFSLSVNTSAPRIQTADPPQWDAYLRRSRNLLKISHLPARINRLITGADAIRHEWTTLPATRHPSFNTDRNKWLIECHPIPALPSEVQGGVGGLLIICHSSWDEMNVSTNKVKQTISFDRTFVLGPGKQAGDVRIVNDSLCLRAFGGSDAWQLGTAVEPPDVPEGYGIAALGKPDDQVQREAIVLTVAYRTRLTLKLAEECISSNGWDMDKAISDFERVKASLPTSSFW